MDKVVFVAFFQGEVLANKVKRICDGYVMAWQQSRPKHRFFLSHTVVFHHALPPFRQKLAFAPLSFSLYARIEQVHCSHMDTDNAHRFGATCYPCPESYAERKALAQRVSSSIEELQMVLSRTDEFRKRVLSDIADNYEEWYVRAGWTC